MSLVLKKEHCLKDFVHWNTTQPTTGLQYLALMFQMTAADLQKSSTFTHINLSVKNIETTPGMLRLFLK